MDLRWCLTGWTALTTLIIQVNCLCILRSIIGFPNPSNFMFVFFWGAATVTSLQAVAGITASIVGPIALFHGATVKNLQLAMAPACYILNAVCSIIIYTGFIHLLSHFRRNSSRFGCMDSADGEIMRLVSSSFA
ncbi:hypothetical protein DL93DRAFT_1785967 [Clavulina sp. PMI_390]|nr:hypothetical protein DL93DRAFT_1785967 [Clavulina sp. PMI_390]